MTLFIITLLLFPSVFAQYCLDDSGIGFNANTTNGVVLLTTQLVANDIQAQARFGKAGSISGNREIICAYQWDSALTNTGKCYAFNRSSAGVWGQVQAFTGPNPGANDWFGYAVAVDGVYAVIGAPQDTVSSRQYAGSAVMYWWNGTAWANEIRITHPNPDWLDL